VQATVMVALEASGSAQARRRARLPSARLRRLLAIAQRVIQNVPNVLRKRSTILGCFAR
jgi:hypothetical protein